MKAVIFAGGVGTRLWPLSRKDSPKQFEKVVGDKSTLQLAAERLLPEFSEQDIIVSTGKAYIETVKEQLPFLPDENIIAEPEKKDVGPAVALVMAYLNKNFPNEPVIILWSDHLVKKIELFKKIITAASDVVKDKKDSIVFIGQKPRFASDNLGWINFGTKEFAKEGITFFSFKHFVYRPKKNVAEDYVKSEEHCWNLGYFVSTPAYILKQFQTHSKDIYAIVQKLQDYDDHADFIQKVDKHFKDMPEISFDNAVLEHLDTTNTYVVVEDIGWSDVGAWEALKEALEEKRQDNIIKGRVLLENSQDNLVYNFNGDKMVVGIDLEDLLVVNTDDVILVARKSSVEKIKKLVESFRGTENEYLT